MQAAIGLFPWPPAAWAATLASSTFWYSSLSGACWPRPGGLLGSKVPPARLFQLPLQAGYLAFSARALIVRPTSSKPAIRLLSSPPRTMPAAIAISRFTRAALPSCTLVMEGRNLPQNLPFCRTECKPAVGSKAGSVLGGFGLGAKQDQVFGWRPPAIAP